MDCPDFYCYFSAYPFLLFSSSVLHFLVVVSVTHVSFRARVKIASRLASQVRGNVSEGQMAGRRVVWDQIAIDEMTTTS